jgi:transcriptional regulator with XRE-family HTH domain
MTFRSRFTNALCRRIWPQTDLARKQLAHAIGVSGGTLDLWLRGHGSPSAEALAELVRFFHSRGDRLFKYEVFNIEPPPMVPEPLLAALQAYRQAEARQGRELEMA